MTGTSQTNSLREEEEVSYVIHVIPEAVQCCWQYHVLAMLAQQACSCGVVVQVEPQPEQLPRLDPAGHFWRLRCGSWSFSATSILLWRRET